jgi:hypothetical protein
MDSILDKEKILSLFKTLIFLLIIEVFASTILPYLGFVHFRFSIDQLIIIYIAIKLNTDHTPFLIFIIEYVHSFFTIKGWEVGTISGVLMALVINFFKDVIQLNSIGFNIVIVFFFQLIWNVVTGFLLFVKMNNFELFKEIMFKSITEGLFLSIISPVVFILLDKIWKIKSLD